jgi:peptidoglycan/xylan/chitin deacetylase (PgdA/CDA1 family)
MKQQPWFWFHSSRHAKMKPMNPWAIGAPVALAAAAGIFARGAVSPASQLFGPTLRCTPSSRQFALTFDDGPNPAVTPQLLDLLDRHRVRATFFMIGQFVRQCPALAREVAARGHGVGNHTETHPKLVWLSRSQIRDELARCQQAISEVVGTTPSYMRPPWGLRSPMLTGAARESGIRHVIMWTIMPGDWRPPSLEWLIQRMQPIAERTSSRRPSRAVGGDVLVLHDGDHRRLNGDRSRTVAALEHWIPRWLDLGLEFVTIDSLLTAQAG